MYIPIIIPWNNNVSIECDTLWQYMLITIGLCVATIRLIGLILSAFVSMFHDLENILMNLCGISLGVSACFIGVWSAVLADNTNGMLILCMISFVSSFVLSVVYGVFKIKAYLKKKGVDNGKKSGNSDFIPSA